MIEKNLGMDKFSSASSDFLRSLRQSSQEHSTANLLKIEEISSHIDDCITGINRSSKSAQLRELRNSIKKLEAEITETSIEKAAIEAKESAYQLSLLNEDKIAKEKEKANLSKKCEELMEICCNLEEGKAVTMNKLLSKYKAIKYVIKAYEKTLDCKIVFESKDIFKCQFNSAKDVFFKIKKEGDSTATWKLLEIHPQLKCQMDIMKFINEVGDYQGLYCLFHAISKEIDKL